MVVFLVNKVFEQLFSSVGDFNAVYAEFRRGVSQCFERRSSSGEGLKRNKTIPFILLKKGSKTGTPKGDSGYL